MDATEGREQARNPEDLSRLVVERLNAADVDALVALYEPDAVLALPDGRTATGLQQIRAAYEGIVAGRPAVTSWAESPRSGGTATPTGRP